MDLKIEQSWKERLGGEFDKEYFADLITFLKKENEDGAVYPAPENIFHAFNLCPFAKVKVVILGQDPYHGENQANGLAFAVDEREPIPPSLKNIFKEIDNDVCGGLTSAKRNGDLSRWAEQGVLLLNATLTVRAHQAGSHQKKGWEQFTDATIRALSEDLPAGRQGRAGIIFMLWGNYAKEKGTHIDRTKHLVLEAPHPSPLSAYTGFFGSKHFSKANEYLIAHNETPIDWL